MRCILVESNTGSFVIHHRVCQLLHKNRTTNYARVYHTLPVATRRWRRASSRRHSNGDLEGHGHRRVLHRDRIRGDDGGRNRREVVVMERRRRGARRTVDGRIVRRRRASLRGNVPARS